MISLKFTFWRKIRASGFSLSLSPSLFLSLSFSFFLCTLFLPYFLHRFFIKSRKSKKILVFLDRNVIWILKLDFPKLDYPKLDFLHSFSKKKAFFRQYCKFSIWGSVLNIPNYYIFWIYIQLSFQRYMIHIYSINGSGTIIFSQREV